MHVPQKVFNLDPEIAKVEFNKSIAGCYRDGNAEYDSVGVLFLTWKEDDLNCKEEEVNALEQVFKDKFKFKTEQYEIPPTESADSLFNRLQAFSRCYDSPSKLGIIYYGGHAERNETEEGLDLELFARISRNDGTNGGIIKTTTNLSEISSLDSPVETKRPFERIEQPHISFKAIYEQIENFETDILLIVDSCFAAGAFMDQPFGGRKCELFCSIAEGTWAKAPGWEGSFTMILTRTLVEMIQETPDGFSTSDLYRRIYQQQHQARKPFYFIQSRFDFGRIWLRPCSQKDEATTAPNESKYTIDVRFHLTKSLNTVELNKVVKALQWIPYVQLVKMQNMHSPNDDLSEFIRTVYLANRLRPYLARIRRKIELKKARQLCRTDSSPPSPGAMTSERFHVHEPRDVRLFDWSTALAVTPCDERFTSDQYFQSKNTPDPKLHDSGAPAGPPKQPGMANAALQVLSQGAQQDANVQPGGTVVHQAGSTLLSQRTLDGLIFFAAGVIAPTVLSWVIHGSASPSAVP